MLYGKNCFPALFTFLLPYLLSKLTNLLNLQPNPMEIPPCLCSVASVACAASCEGIEQSGGLRGKLQLWQWVYLDLCPIC